MTMDLQFESMAGLLVDGHHTLITNHFGCSEEQQNQISEIASSLYIHVRALVEQMHKTGSLAGACECHLLKKAFVLVDERIKPVTPAEIAYVSFMMSRVLEPLVNYMVQQQALVTARQAPIPKFSNN